jgi:hypothetical protein
VKTNLKVRDVFTYGPDPWPIWKEGWTKRYPDLHTYYSLYIIGYRKYLPNSASPVAVAYEQDITMDELVQYIIEESEPGRLREAVS